MPAFSPSSLPYPDTAHAPRRHLGPALITLGVLGGLIVLSGAWVATRYNGLVRQDQAVQSQWAQVENVYQRRADLVPNLVDTVKGAAGFEQQTLTAVTEARAKARRAHRPRALVAPGASSATRPQQEQLGSALSRLLVVVEPYPELKATENFRDLQSQLEGTENRIAVERMRFNEAAQTFNTSRNSFPTNLVAGLFGSRFGEKAYFKAQAGAQEAPKVQF